MGYMMVYFLATQCESNIERWQGLSVPFTTIQEAEQARACLAETIHDAAALVIVEVQLPVVNFYSPS